MGCEVNRAKWIGMGLCFALGAVIACSQVPTGTLGNGGESNEHHEQLVLEARDAFERDPRSIKDVEEGAAKFAHALKLYAGDYATLWQAARVAAWLGEYGRDNREQHVKDGIVYANTALKVNPEGTEARFYHGVLAGLLGDLDNSYGMDAVKHIESRMTGLIDEQAEIAHGGPQRVYGVLLLRAPGPPTSIGSLRNARKQLEAAVEIAPDWPENQLYMAEWEFAWADDKDNPEFAQKARDRLSKHLLGPEAGAPADAKYEFGVWQERARKLLKDNE
jgi:hypothetical protein